MCLAAIPDSTGTGTGSAGSTRWIAFWLGHAAAAVTQPYPKFPAIYPPSGLIEIDFPDFVSVISDHIGRLKSKMGGFHSFTAAKGNSQPYMIGKKKLFHCEFTLIPHSYGTPTHSHDTGQSQSSTVTLIGRSHTLLTLYSHFSSRRRR